MKQWQLACLLASLTDQGSEAMAVISLYVSVLTDQDNGSTEAQLSLQ